MFNSNGGYSLSDIAAVSGNNGRNNGMFGDEGGAWWIIILFLFVFCGWGNNSWGNGGMNGTTAQLQPALTRGELCQDMNFNDVQSGVRGVQQGLCDGFYAMNTGMLNGFSGVQSALCQGFSGVNTAITNGNYENQLAVQGLASQLADCCCKTQTSISDLGYKLQDCCCTTQRAIDGVNYNMATNTCAITTAINNSTRDIVESNNANYRALHDEIVANRIEDKNAEIARQQNEIQALRLAASQAAQNNYLVDQLRPCPIPAYTVPNPFVGCGCGFGYGA